MNLLPAWGSGRETGRSCLRFSGRHMGVGVFTPGVPGVGKQESCIAGVLWLVDWKVPAIWPCNIRPRRDSLQHSGIAEYRRHYIQTVQGCTVSPSGHDGLDPWSWARDLYAPGGIFSLMMAYHAWHTNGLSSPCCS